MRQANDKGFTLIELVVVVAIVAILAAVAVPGLFRARKAGDEASAIGSLAAINKGQANFAASCGSGYYAPDLKTLGTGPDGNPANAYVSPDIGWANTVMKSGYRVAIASTGGAVADAPATCNGVAAGRAVRGYHATALAVTGQSRDFGTNAGGTIYFTKAGTPLDMTDTGAGAAAKSLQ